jgi:hypothetical protein
MRLISWIHPRGSEHSTRCIWRAQLGLTPPSRTSPWFAEYLTKLGIIKQLFGNFFSIPSDTHTLLF